MHLRQVKRERPSLKSAHQFFKEGSFSVDPSRHSLSGKEREAEILKIGDALSSIVKRQFPRTQNLEYAVLKLHLIIEYALVQFIRSHAQTYVEEKNLRFTFSQKLEIAYLLGFGVNDPILLPTVEGINKIRNQVAHSFSMDRNIVDELIRINHDEYNDLIISSDKERIRYLRNITRFICGRVAGEIYASYAIEKHIQDKAFGSPS